MLVRAHRSFGVEAARGPIMTLAAHCYARGPDASCTAPMVREPVSTVHETPPMTSSATIGFSSRIRPDYVAVSGRLWRGGGRLQVAGNLGIPSGGHRSAPDLQSRATAASLRVAATEAGLAGASRRSVRCTALAVSRADAVATSPLPA